MYTLDIVVLFTSNCLKYHVNTTAYDQLMKIYTSAWSRYYRKIGIVTDKWQKGSSILD